ncbi:type VI secretion system tip protein TssI/VgrG [Pseudomonas sp. St316]|uniref:type VI secretion system tip protein TssI/VgrG n=1 Tax=Pseudomonas sp. St316 TaxID=2678257 RepID=UPI001BB3C9A9|nr:type VI secretion system tip protein TssI/VgrG [Pseudomonas sp. St316]BBP59712.1 hypothetical protein PHLH4_33020 [Pseudomonas sp. St316]
MFNPANQTHFSLTIDGFEQDFQVLAFTGEEAISRPYLFNVEFVSERSDLDLESLFDVEAFLTFDSKGNGIHGRIYHIAHSSNGQRLTRYRLALVPHLSYLRHRINQRIYQQFPVPKIVALILEEHGILGDAYRFHLGATYPERDYCAQYDETDLHFIQRLCEEEGIHFHFQHRAQGHVLVFGDDQSVFPRIGQPTAYSPERLRTLEHSHAVYRQAQGQSDQTPLVSGHVLEISGHPRQEWNAPWLLTQVIHEGKQVQASSENVASGNTENGGDFHQGYRNRFIALAWNVSYRPPLAHEKPRILCNQTAVVLSLEDDEIGHDCFARIKVKLPWDREDRFDDKSCCWLKGASNWRCKTGPPRPGMEVRVTFLENDPDQPLIGGCLCCC